MHGDQPAGTHQQGNEILGSNGRLGLPDQREQHSKNNFWAPQTYSGYVDYIPGLLSMFVVCLGG